MENVPWENVPWENGPMRNGDDDWASGEEDMASMATALRPGHGDLVAMWPREAVMS